MKKNEIKLNTLPESPGCYLMKNSKKQVIYVGKAINLKKRVNQYFNKAHDLKTTRLVSEIEDFEIIIAENEKEALILEYNLIKKYKPKFNIIFMDDKSYPYILVTDEKYFKVDVVRIRNKKKQKGMLFGPYPNAYAAHGVVDLINKIFPIRKCKTLPKEVCLYYHLKQCLGYCAYKINDDIIQNLKKQVVKFLKGDNQFILDELIKKRDQASLDLNFESAKEYQDLILAVDHIKVKQTVEFNDKKDIDFINYYVSDNYLTLCILNFRNGQLLNRQIFMSSILRELKEEISSYLVQYYEKNIVPHEIIVADEEIKDGLNVYFDNELAYSVSKGPKKTILDKAKENAYQHYLQNTKMLLRNERYYQSLQLNFNKIFKKDINIIEIFDNSHFYGKNTVGAMLVYKDFKPFKKAYRHYKLQDGYDDLKSMYEVLYRRYFKALSDGNVPDLLIVDGGKNQIKVAKEIIEEFKLDIIIVGLVKDEKHNTANLMNVNYEIINLSEFQEVFLFLAKLQDEVHDFALSYNEKLRKKQLFNQELLKISGVGENIATKLLKKFGSLDNVKKQEISELKSVVSLKVAENVYNYFRGNDDGNN